MQEKFGFPTDPLTFTLFQIWYGIKWRYKHTHIFNKDHLIEKYFYRIRPTKYRCFFYLTSSGFSKIFIIILITPMWRTFSNIIFAEVVFASHGTTSKVGQSAGLLLAKFFQTGKRFWNWQILHVFFNIITVSSETMIKLCHNENLNIAF